jgi:hypothetical protein
VQPGEADDADDFVRVERLHEHVVASEVEDLGPEEVVGGAGGDDEKGVVAEGGERTEQVSPGAIGEFGVAEDDGHGVAAEEVGGLGAVTGGVDDPVGMGEQVTEEAEVFFGRADGEDANGAIGERLRGRAGHGGAKGFIGSDAHK